MDWLSPGLVLAGARIGGLNRGLTGSGPAHGASLDGLQVLEPAVAAQLVSVASIAGHPSALPTLWRDSDWRELGPMLVGGLVGVPIGLCLLPLIKVELFKMAVGIILICYCAFYVSAPPGHLQASPPQ